MLYGATAGISAAGNELWRQGAGGIADVPEVNDAFGRALTVGRFNDDGYADLVVGVPSEDAVSIDTGIVHVLPGSSAGLSGAGDQLWRQGVGGVGENDDTFGRALAAG